MLIEVSVYISWKIIWNLTIHGCLKNTYKVKSIFLWKDGKCSALVHTFQFWKGMSQCVKTDTDSFMLWIICKWNFWHSTSCSYNLLQLCRQNGKTMKYDAPECIQTNIQTVFTWNLRYKLQNYESTLDLCNTVFVMHVIVSGVLVLLLQSHEL